MRSSLADTCFQGPKKCSTTRSTPLHSEAARWIQRAIVARATRILHAETRTRDYIEEVVDDAEGREQNPWWALRDSNPRPQPCESLPAPFRHLGLPGKAQLRRQMTRPLLCPVSPCFRFVRARGAHAGPAISSPVPPLRVIACYHDGVTKKVTTVRMPEEMAETVEVVARGRGMSVNALVIEALQAEIEKVRQDKDFVETLRRLTERDKEILDRLAQ